MKRYSYTLQETDWKGETFVAGNTKCPARTVVSTWKKRDGDITLSIGNKLHMIRVDGCSGFYHKDKRIDKEKVINILMEMSSF